MSKKAQDHPLARLMSLWNGQKYKNRGNDAEEGGIGAAPRQRQLSSTRSVVHGREMSSNSKGAAGCVLCCRGISVHLGAPDGQPAQGH